MMDDGFDGGMEDDVDLEDREDREEETNGDGMNWPMDLDDGLAAGGAIDDDVDADGREQEMDDEPDSALLLVEQYNDVEDNLRVLGKNDMFVQPSASRSPSPSVHSGMVVLTLTLA